MTGVVRKAPRGQALMALAMVLAGWTTARLAWIDEGDAVRALPLQHAPSVARNRQPAPRRASAAHSGPEIALAAAPSRPAKPAGASALLWAASAPAAMEFLPPPAPLRFRPQQRQSGAAQRQWAYLASLGYAPAAQPAPEAAALRGAPGRGVLAPPLAAQPPGAFAPPRAAGAARDRWLLDLWGFYRRSAAPALAAGQGQYGGRQAGAVVQYRLAPDSRHDPRAYLRATIDGDGPVLASGVSARPLAGLPVSGFAEQRLHLAASAKGARHQSVIGAVTQLPPIALPAGASAEIYGQAGYAHGRQSTPFFDGQIIMERPLATGENGTALHVGAGAWAGGQDDAARLDIGPRLSLRLKLAASQGPVKGHARLALDWRQRVAGNAAPDNGLALTLSGSF